MKLLFDGGSDEIIEKKSRFIATTLPVESEEEALNFIAALKKKYWNATHNCFAYTIGDRHQLARCSDDGEPQGTAGRPMLEVLLGEDVHNVAVVVTRYFGGTLLGTGGLVRAYSKSTQAGLAASTIVDRRDGMRLGILTDYTGLGKIQYILGQRHINIIESTYTDVVTVYALVPDELVTEVTEAVTEATAGRAKYIEKTKVTYAFLEGEPIIFD